MRKLIYPILVAVLLLAGCGPKEEAPVATSQLSQPVSTETAAPLPDFTVFNENADPVKLSDFQGKPIVLNFWASWCGPCKAEMPAFQKAYEDLGDEVQFVMVNVGEPMQDGQAFISAAGYTFPVFFDSQSEAAAAYQVTAIPASYFIDAEGNLVDAHVGTMQESDLLAAIEAIQ